MSCRVYDQASYDTLKTDLSKPGKQGLPRKEFEAKSYDMRAATHRNLLTVSLKKSSDLAVVTVLQCVYLGLLRACHNTVTKYNKKCRIKRDLQSIQLKDACRTTSDPACAGRPAEVEASSHLFLSEG